MLTATVEDIVQGLHGYGGRAFPAPGLVRRAAVAVIVREEDPHVGAELLLIHRAVHEGDRWSGHMAFPGGKVEPEDKDTRQTSERETCEEIGWDLRQCALHVGRLKRVPTMISHPPRPLLIRPHVFVAHTVPKLTINAEVQSVVWVPLSFFGEPSNREHFVWRKMGLPLRMPCYHFEGRKIWGLTLQMIDDLMAQLRIQTFQGSRGSR